MWHDTITPLTFGSCLAMPLSRRQRTVWPARSHRGLVGGWVAVYRQSCPLRPVYPAKACREYGLMRAGAPDSLDRMVAISYANLAVDQLIQGHSGRMVALQNGQYTSVPVDTCMQGLKRVDVAELYDAEEYRPKVRHVLGKPMVLY